MPASAVRVAPARVARGERGRTLEAIGGTILGFDVLVLFYLPAGIKLGQALEFVGLVFVLGVLSVVLLVKGHAASRS